MNENLSFEANSTLRDAIKNNNIDRVKVLVEKGKFEITSLECILAVQFNRMDILNYFIYRIENEPYVLCSALYKAVDCRNLEAIKMLVSNFKKNKDKYGSFNINSVIYRSIADTIDMERMSHCSLSDAIEIVRCISTNFFELL